MQTTAMPKMLVTEAGFPWAVAIVEIV